MDERAPALESTETETLEAQLARALAARRHGATAGGDGANGLAQLVLTLIKLVHELLAKQALRRLEAGSLDDAQAERLGTVLMRQEAEIRALCRQFGIDERDLRLDLGPLGRI